MKKPLSELAKEVISGDRRALSQAITLVESERIEDRGAAARLLKETSRRSAPPHPSLRIGITGLPGAGKSTLIEGLGDHLVRKEQRKVAVLAIDPSSPQSQGSLLGDKVRMERLTRHKTSYVRPSPSGRFQGGVARSTREIICLCEAAGYDTVFVETVGVGQNEWVIRHLTDFCLLLLLTGAGDEWQSMKKGVLDMTDLALIHKADGENKSRAQQTMSQYAQHLRVPVQTFSSLNKDGFTELWQEINKILNQINIIQKRKTQHDYWLKRYVEEELKRRFFQCKEILPSPHSSPTADPLQEAIEQVDTYHQHLKKS